MTSVDVRAGDQTLLTLAGDRLAYWTRVLGNPIADNEIGPGTNRDRVARRRAGQGCHRSHRSGTHGRRLASRSRSRRCFPRTMTADVAPVTVQTRKPAVISPPLDGPNWLDGNSCCDMRRTPDGD